jgi:subtilase family serine protease
VDGSSFSVTDTVQNTGSVAAAASKTRYYLSTTNSKGGARLLTGSRAVPSLAPGAVSSGTVTVTVSVATAAGTYFLLACADDTVVVPETTESNNCKASANKTTVSGPDLTTTNVTDPPTTVVDGSSFSVTDTVQNTGSVAAAASKTRYYLSTTNSKGGARLLTGSRAVPSLAPGAISSGIVTVTVSAGTAAGTYFLLACTDDTVVVPETTESNNCKASANKTTLSGPNLTETGVTNPPATVVDGSSFSLTDTVQNIGNVAAAASTTRYYLSTTTPKSGAHLLNGSRAVPSRDAGAISSGAVTVAVSAGTAAGTYFLLACADDTLVVPETSESNNNCKASAITTMP